MQRSILRIKPFKTKFSASRAEKPRRTKAHASSGAFAPDQHSNRRHTLTGFALLLSKAFWPTSAQAKLEPKAPEVGSCVECIGEVNGGLNACTLTSPSCVSTQNDDEAHFIPPWQYNGDMHAAITDLINLVTGAPPVASSSGYGDQRADTRPKRSSKVEQGPKTSLPENVCFNGRLESRHSTEDGSEYLHFVFGGQNSLDGGVACRNIGIIDAEFIFLSGDNIVDIRTASREDPGLKGSNISLSLSYGVQYDKNTAKREMEEMRKALHWEQTPVVTDFDPRFNQRRPLFFEKLYQPFLRDKQDFEDIVDK